MWRSLLVVVLLAALAALPVATTRAVAKRADVTYLFDDNVPQADQDLIQEAIRFAQDDFIATFGTDVQHSVLVTVKNDPSPSQNFNYSKDYIVHFNIATYRGFPPLIRYQMLTHEYFHIWQQDASQKSFAGPTEVHPFGPQWLAEGSAEYMAYQALTSTGIVSQAEVQERMVRIANGALTPNDASNLPPLSVLQTNADMAQPGRGLAAYSLSALAVQQLVGSRGPRALGEYLQAFRHTNASWETVFAKTFGVSVEDFYASFEAERPSLLTPSGTDVAQLLSTPAYNDVPADVRLGGTPPSLTKGTQAVIYAWSGNGSTCTMTARDGGGKQLVNYTTYGDVYGLAVWLWSVPEWLTEKTVSLELTCGVTPVNVVLSVT